MLQVLMPRQVVGAQLGQDGIADVVKGRGDAIELGSVEVAEDRQKAILLERLRRLDGLAAAFGEAQVWSLRPTKEGNTVVVALRHATMPDRARAMGSKGVSRLAQWVWPAASPIRSCLISIST